MVDFMPQERVPTYLPRDEFPNELFKLTVLNRGGTQGEGAGTNFWLTDSQQAALERAFSSVVASDAIFDEDFADVAPERRQELRLVYPRSRALAGDVKREQGYVCLGCDADPGWLDADGNRYLEAHHLEHLSRGGADAKRNLVALCPNCHRRVHHGADHASFTAELRKRAAKRQRERA
jgi:5-methylcytosine-specific restriction protein A